MRTRLLGIVLSLVALLLLGLGVPLALSVAATVQQRIFLDRLTDTGRYASLVQRPLIDGQPWLVSDKLRRYAELYGVHSVVLDWDAKVVASSAPPVSTPTGSMPTSETPANGQRDAESSVDLHEPAIEDAIVAARAGRHPESVGLLLPWDDSPLVLAEPVLADGEVRGVMVMVSPTDEVRARVWIWWALIALGGLLALGLAVLAALPVVRWTLRPVRRLDEATGSLVTAVVSGREVERVADEYGPTELRRLTRSFDQMAVKVGDVLAAQRAFVADASHQLRNPLTALRLRLGNLEGQFGGEAAEHHQAALAETDRLGRILDDLLSMARAEGQSGDPVVVDVGTVAADRVSDWRVVASSRMVDLEIVGGAQELRVSTPPRAVEAILDALLDNALKFTGPETTVLVELGALDGMAALAVRDHGAGLRPEELERATDRFWRSHAHQNVAGSGLGLAIVRRVAEGAGGEVRLELPEDGGLRVTVHLPLARS